MRPMLALVAALALGAVSAPVFAEPAAVSFDEQRFAFNSEMGDMRREMDRAVSGLETREIAARYQPAADAFADRIETRLRDEGRATGGHDNARNVRSLPERTRQEADRARLYLGAS